jgi:hypothetical protein
VFPRGRNVNQLVPTFEINKHCTTQAKSRVNPATCSAELQFLSGRTSESNVWTSAYLADLLETASSSEAMVVRLCV